MHTKNRMINNLMITGYGVQEADFSGKNKWFKYISHRDGVERTAVVTEHGMTICAGHLDEDEIKAVILRMKIQGGGLGDDYTKERQEKSSRSKKTNRKQR